MVDCISGDYDSPDAPWNDKDIYCTECSSDQLEIYDSGLHKGHKWTSYKCIECGEIIDNEPDYD